MTEALDSKLEPRNMPELRQSMIEWTLNLGAFMWRSAHIRGSKFYLPPGLREMPLELAFEVLAKLNAARLKEAKLFSVTPEMTFLAAKTAMPTYSLTADMLPAPTGFLVWQSPVGAAEQTKKMNLRIDADTGDVIAAALSDWMEGLKREDMPIVAVSWELSEDQSEIFVVWYTHPQDSYWGNYTVDEEVQMRAVSAPLAFEREQLLPLDRQLEWFTSEEPNRLVPTVQVELDKIPANLVEDGIRRNQAILPDLDQLTKTLVATFMLMGMKMTRRDVELPDRPARKRLKRAGVSEGHITSGVQVIKLGQKIRSQKPKEGEPAFRWKNRRIVGPFVRQQWYPSEETHKPKLIEPYIAGPEGAPIGNAEKVYLLSE